MKRLTDLDDCGCCEGLNRLTPVEVYNRPGLKAISYRVGVHALFKQSMLAGLSSHPALHSLTTRQDDDFSIALIDVWAMVADILTFYQERIANESYLRTARERLSLLHMAELIGYELRPGVAAGIYLAFTVKDPALAPIAGEIAPATPSKPMEIIIDKGTKIQSLPDPGGQPQIFETIEKIKTRPEWNAMKPRLTKPHPLNKNLERLTIIDLSAPVKPGDSVLIITDTDRTVRRVQRIASYLKTKTVHIDLVADPQPETLIPHSIEEGQILSYESALTNDFIMNKFISGKSWRQDDILAMATMQKWSHVALENGINSQVPTPQRVSDGVFAFKVHSALFGHNAPRWDSLPPSQRYGEKVKDKNGNIVNVDPVYPKPGWEGRTLAEDAGSTHYVYLDNIYPGIVRDSWIVLENPEGYQRAYQVNNYSEITRSDFCISVKVSRLELYSATDFDKFKLRETTVYTGSFQMELAQVPVTDSVKSDSITLDRADLGLEAGQTIFISGELSDLKGVNASQVMELSEVTLVEGYTKLTFKKKLVHKYLLSTIRVNANVAAATHGESKEEILGSGDTTRPFQSFTLHQPPLTYISASNPRGAESTLQVRVNDVMWYEVPTFYGHGPTEHIYITRTDDDGMTSVRFGDGITGARLPTGQENVEARYRKGMGIEGLVKAGQITLLMTRPLGAQGVINLQDADGADDGESRENARSNAPLTMLTLDRIVSLQDFEDFAQSYTGISKALATWTWDGQKRGIFVTVAGPKGAAIMSDSTLYEHLITAMHKAGDPSIPLQVRSYRPALFRLSATITVDLDFQPEEVLAAVEEKLRTHFSFDERTFGQPVILSEVVAVIQAVEGVTAVNVTRLYRSNTTPDPLPPDVLIAAMPEAGTDVTKAAELLILDPNPLTEMGVSQ